MEQAVFGARGFKARSGRVVKANEDGSISFENLHGYVGKDVAFDAEEFFQAKRDAELGRWRYPLDPDVVTYPLNDNGVWVVNERTHDVGAFRRGGAGAARSGYAAAQAHFEAHPVRKPWEDAQLGEVWVLAAWGIEVAARLSLAGNSFLGIGGGVVRFEDITAARRIWPEDAS